MHDPQKSLGSLQEATLVERETDGNDEATSQVSLHKLNGQGMGSHLQDPEEQAMPASLR